MQQYEILKVEVAGVLMIFPHHFFDGCIEVLPHFFTLASTSIAPWQCLLCAILTVPRSAKVLHFLGHVISLARGQQFSFSKFDIMHAFDSSEFTCSLLSTYPTLMPLCLDADMMSGGSTAAIKSSSSSSSLVPDTLFIVNSSLG